MCLFTKGELVMRKLKQIWHKIKAIPFIGDNYEKDRKKNAASTGRNTK